MKEIEVLRTFKLHYTVAGNTSVLSWFVSLLLKKHARSNIVAGKTVNQYSLVVHHINLYIF